MSSLRAGHNLTITTDISINKHKSDNVRRNTQNTNSVFIVISLYRIL